MQWIGAIVAMHLIPEMRLQLLFQRGVRVKRRLFAVRLTCLNEMGAPTPPIAIFNNAVDRSDCWYEPYPGDSHADDSVDVEFVGAMVTWYIYIYGRGYKSEQQQQQYCG